MQENERKETKIKVINRRETRESDCWFVFGWIKRFRVHMRINILIFGRIVIHFSLYYVNCESATTTKKRFLFANCSIFQRFTKTDQIKAKKVFFCLSPIFQCFFLFLFYLIFAYKRRHFFSVILHLIKNKMDPKNLTTIFNNFIKFFFSVFIRSVIKL